MSADTNYLKIQRLNLLKTSEENQIRSAVNGRMLRQGSILPHFFFFFNVFFFFIIYFWDRERQSMNGGGAEREGDTESETGSRL